MHHEGRLSAIDFLQHVDEGYFFPRAVGRVTEQGEAKVAARRCADEQHQQGKRGSHA